MILTEEENVKQLILDLGEALTTSQRIKAKRRFQKNRAKIKLGRRRSKNRTASKETIKKRAQKDARRKLEKDILGGKSKSELSFSQRQALEKRVDRKKSEVTRLSKRGVHDAKRRDQSRRSGKRESVDYSSIVESLEIIETATIESSLTARGIDHVVTENVLSFEDSEYTVVKEEAGFTLVCSDTVVFESSNTPNDIVNITEMIDLLA